MTDDSQKIRKDMEKTTSEGKSKKGARYALEALGGMIPFAGGYFGAASSAWSDHKQKQYNKLLETWMKLQEEMMKEMGMTIAEIYERIDMTNEKVHDRVESPEYLSLLKKSFRDWSGTESEEKRKLIRNLLSNAASCDLTSDDVVRLFIDWIDKYSEMHFKVMREVYTTPRISRYGMWINLHGDTLREDSAEADLFKTIIHDLSVGHVIRQHRPVDHMGRFIKPPRKKPTRGGGSDTYKSAFDNEKPYELTSLGKQFIHYTMNEIVPKIEAKPKTEEK